MSFYLFDTMVHVAAAGGRIPEKWQRHWKEVRMGVKGVVLAEPQVAELTERLAMKSGFPSARDRIFWLKGLARTLVPVLDDLDAMQAGRAKMRNRECGISMVDAFILVSAKKHGARLFTTDQGLRDACRQEGVSVDFLPVGALS